ncbi:MAG: hypothetical protein ACRDFS_07165, partial [Chloroflexota bacterium]
MSVVATTLVLAGCGAGVVPTSGAVVAIRPSPTAIAPLPAVPRLRLACPSLAATATAASNPASAAWMNGAEATLTVLRRVRFELASGHHALTQGNFAEARELLSAGLGDAGTAGAAVAALQAGHLFPPIERELRYSYLRFADAAHVARSAARQGDQSTGSGFTAQLRRGARAAQLASRDLSSIRLAT